MQKTKAIAGCEFKVLSGRKYQKQILGLFRYVKFIEGIGVNKFLRLANITEMVRFSKLVKKDRSIRSTRKVTAIQLGLPCLVMVTSHLQFVGEGFSV